MPLTDLETKSLGARIEGFSGEALKAITLKLMEIGIEKPDVFTKLLISIQ